jgi:hypothetical protein
MACEFEIQQASRGIGVKGPSGQQPLHHGQIHSDSDVKEGSSEKKRTLEEVTHLQNDEPGEEVESPVEAPAKKYLIEEDHEQQDDTMVIDDDDDREQAG